MANFPTSIYAPRTKANRAGVVYDPTKTTRLFAEDVSKLDAEVVSLETILGLSPNWASASIAERIKGIRSLSGANEGVITIKGANVGIGIGTATPGAKLEVYGAGLFDWAGGSNGIVYFGDVNHGIKSTVGGGVTVFSYGVVNGIYLQQITGNVGIGTASPSAKMDILSDILRLRTAKTPATAGAAGNAGDICWDATHLYVCVATNTWMRSLLATW